MAETTGDPALKPLRDLVGRALAHGTKRINFWDTNHGSPLPREVFSDPGLLATVARYGTPAYVFEMVGADMPMLVDAYRKGTPQQRQAVLAYFRNVGENYSTNPAVIERYATSYQHMFDAKVNGRPVDIIMPDTRPSLSDKDRLIMGVVLKNYSEMPDACRATSLDDGVNALPSDTKADVTEAIQHFHNLADNNNALKSGALDADIAARARALTPARDIPIMLYGAGHYLKQHDLDEHLPGLSIGIVDSKHRVSLTDAEYTDTPDYAWYADTHRLVRLNTPAAKAEFLGAETKAPAREAPAAKMSIFQALFPSNQEDCTAITQSITEALLDVTGTDATPPTPTPKPERARSPRDR